MRKPPKRSYDDASSTAPSHLLDNRPRTPGFDLSARHAQSDQPSPRIAARVGSGLVAVVAAVLLVLAVVLVAIPKATGGMALTVLTGSMEPTIAPGDVVVTRAITAENLEALQVGDVIAFLPFPDDPTIVTHRIVGAAATPDGPGFVTKGDANGVRDPWGPMTAKQIRGEVLYTVPKIGYLREWAGEYAGILIPITAAMLIGYAGIAFATTLRKSDRKAPRKAVASQ